MKKEATNNICIFMWLLWTEPLASRAPVQSLFSPHAADRDRIFLTHGGKLPLRPPLRALRQQLCCVLGRHRWNKGDHFAHIPPLQHQFTWGSAGVVVGAGRATSLSGGVGFTQHPNLFPYLLLVGTRSRRQSRRRSLSSSCWRGGLCSAECGSHLGFVRRKKSTPKNSNLLWSLYDLESVWHHLQGLTISVRGICLKGPVCKICLDLWFLFW